MRNLTVVLLTFVVQTLAFATPPAPTGVKAVPKASNRIDVSWSNVTGESGYQVQRRLAGTTPWSIAGTVGADITTFSDFFSFVARKKYEYQVIATSGAGNSPPSTMTWSVAVFTGPPFSDWLNAADFGANGQDGNDDTQALQQALNALNVDGLQGNQRLAPDLPHVLYIPNGTYYLSDTLFLEGRLGLLIYGQSAGGVVFEWNGASGTSATATKPMIHSDGAPRSVFKNLVWDGGSDRGKLYVVAFDESYCGASGNFNFNAACTGLGNSWYQLKDAEGFADIGTMHIDSTFRNSWIGLRIGHWHVQDSEMTIRRCQFLNNDFGTSIEDFNALDIWFWDCLFEGNREVGITDEMPIYGGTPGNYAGDFRVIRGRFLNNCSVSSNPNCANHTSGPSGPYCGGYCGGGDITMSPDGQVTVQGSWSKGSARFLVVNPPGLTGAVHPVSLIRNKIDNFDQQNAYQARAVTIYSPGPLLLLGNEIDTSRSGVPRDFPVEAETWMTTDVVALHNKYTTSQPYSGGNKKVFQNDDPTIGTFDLPVPGQPAVSPVLERPVYTVTDAANAQDVIDAAVADPNPAIVHFPSGFYPRSTSLTVPSGQDLTIMGNGMNTWLRWTGVANGVQFDIDGYQPHGLTIRDLQLGADPGAVNRAVAIRINDFNQDDARLYVSKFESGKGSGAAHVGVLIDGVPRPSVNLIDTQVYGLAGDGETDIGVRVVAGPQNPQAAPFQSGVWMWTGLLNSNDYNTEVVNGTNGVRTLFANTYSEGSARDHLASGGGTGGEVCLFNGKSVGIGTSATDLIGLDDFGGNVSVIQKSMFEEDLQNEGVRLEQSGPSPVSVQMIGNAVRWDPEYSVTSADLIRVNERYVCQGSKDPNLPGCENGSLPLSDVGSFPADNSKVDTAVNLVRNYDPPGHYDESGTAPYQLNIDNVFVGYATAPLQVLGGIPGAPTGLEATLTPAFEASLHWTDGSSNEDYFEIRRDTSPGGTFPVIDTTSAQSTSYTDATAPMGTTVYYRVNASRNRTGDSGFTEDSLAIPAAGNLLNETFQGTQAGYDLSGWAESGSPSGATITPNATDNPPVPGNGFFGEALRAQATTNSKHRRTEHSVTSTAAVCGHARLYISQAGLANGQGAAIFGLLKNNGSLGSSGQPATLSLVRNSSGQLQLALTVRNAVVATTNITVNTNYGIKVAVNDTSNTWSFQLATGSGSYVLIGSGALDPAASVAKIGLGIGSNSSMNQPTSIFFDKVEVYSSSCP